MFLLQFFTVAVGLAVVVLLAAVLVGIWESVRGDREVKKLERRRAVTKDHSPVLRRRQPLKNFFQILHSHNSCPGRKTAVGNYLFLHIRRAFGRGYLARWTYPHGLVWAEIPSRSSDREDGFLDLRDGVIADLIELQMWKVRHLVGCHDAIDNRRAVDLKCLIDLGEQLTGLRGPKSMAAAGARQRGEIRVGKFDALPERRQAYGLCLQRDQPECGIVVDHDLHRQLMSPVFWLLYIMFVMVSASGLIATAQIAPIASDFNVGNQIVFWGATTLTAALIIDNLVNGAARPLFGWISDNIGRELIAEELAVTSPWSRHGSFSHG